MNDEEDRLFQCPILDNLCCGVVTLDRRLAITSWNAWLEKYSNIPRSRALNSNLLELFPSLQDSRLLESIKNAIELKLPSGISSTLNATPFPLFHDMGTTSRRPLEQSLFIQPMTEEEKGPVCLIQINDMTSAVARERTLASQMEQRIKAEKKLARFKTTLDLTVDCVFMFEPENLQFLYVNQGAINQVGYSETELFAMSPWELMPHVDGSEFRRLIDPLASGMQNSLVLEEIYKHKDGHEIPVEVHLQYLAPADEEARYIAVVRDISERKRIEKVKAEFISTVSHELRTPLTSLQASLKLVCHGITGVIPVESQELLEIANANANRLLLLVNDILDIEKLEHDAMVFKFRKFPLGELMEEAVKQNSSYAEKFDVELELSPSKCQGVEVKGDYDRLMQVLANLISNAVKFSPAGGKVRLFCRRKRDHITLCVEDQGCGIPKRFQARLFEKFTQSDVSDTRQRGGTGLGLTIAKSIVERHSSRLLFTTEEGKGTTFYFDLVMAI